MNTFKFKYGATIVVIIQNQIEKGGLFPHAIPTELWKINEMTIEDQWKILEASRNSCGGMFFTKPCSESAFRELLDDYIGDDGIMNETGMKIVHTKSHGDFCVNLMLLDGREDFEIGDNV